MSALSSNAPSPVALASLADVALPAPIPWWPQTWGWAVLAGLLSVLAVWLVIRGYKHYQTNRYRREALLELKKLETQLLKTPLTATETRSNTLAAMAALLKRVALAGWPRSEVASLTSTSWIDFLQQHQEGIKFPDNTVRLLIDIQYQSTQGLASVTEKDAQDFSRAIQSFIEKHRVTAKHSLSENHRVSA